MHTKPYRRSAATAILARAGVFHREIADQLGIPSTTVQAQLSGRLAPHPLLISAIEQLSDAATARKVDEVLGRIAQALKAADDAS